MTALATAQPEQKAAPARSPPVLVSTAVASVLCAIYLAVPRMGNDLSAQLARADFARTHPLTSVDLRWFGGILPFNYSLWTPQLMALVGVKLTGALATVASVWLLSRLLQAGGAVHPLLGSLAGVFSLGANLVEGRVTFAVGVACGLGALLSLASRPRRGAAVVLGLLAAGASPVAALFLGLCAAALLLTRRLADGLALGVAALLPLLMTSFVYADNGIEDFYLQKTVWAIEASALVLFFVRQRQVRIVAALGIVMVWVSYAIDSPVGSNATRLSMLFALPLLLGYLRMDGQLRRWRVPFPAYAAAVAVLGYFVQPFLIAGTVGGTGRPVTYPSYFGPLVTELHSRGPLTGRVEVTELTGYWDAAYLARHVPLARGWARQLDIKMNEDVFYHDNLTPRTYRSFLERSAVQYVAVADARPTHRGGAEKKLVTAGLPYLHEVWSGRHWRLYAVDDPQPVVSGARLDAYRPDRITFTVEAAGDVRVRIRWLRELALHGPPGPCLRADAGSVVLHDAPTGTYTISSHLLAGSRTC